MSRTDKDAPWWVRVEYYEPVHSGCPNLRPPRKFWQWRLGVGVRECDLPETPMRYNWRTAPRRTRWDHCTWEPLGWDRKYYTRPPRRDDRRVYFHGPNRRVMRDFCVKVRREYAGSGDVEAVEPGPRRSQLDWWD